VHIDDLDEIPQTAVVFINQDHAEVVRLLRVLVDALRSGAGERATTEAWSALLVFTQEHFEREEAAMLEVRFPPYLVHKAEHDRVLGEMSARFAVYLASGESTALLEYAAREVPDWIERHLLSMDHVTAEYIADRWRDAGAATAS
jgi:hemerythrin